MWNNQNVRLTAVFILGLIVGFGAYWLWLHNHSSNSENYVASRDETTISTSQDNSGGMIQGNNGVIVNDQTPGGTVTVSEVLLQHPGWVAIQDDVNGEPGKILGAKLFDVGTSTGRIELLRHTVSGHSYFAVLHTDDGDYHHFTPSTDKVLTDSTGAPVMVKFNVTTDTASTSTQ